MKPKAPVLSTQRRHIQAVLNSGFGWLTHSRFGLLAIRDVCAAKRWLDALLASDQMHTAEDMKSPRNQLERSYPKAAAVAFSFAGLGKIGIVQAEEFPFPTAFGSGMGSAAREELLRDSPRHGWSWGDTESSSRHVAHVLLAQWCKESRFALPAADLFAQAFDAQWIVGDPSCFQNGVLHEPFGFRDGIAQPVLDGLREEDGTADAQARRDAGSELFKDRAIAAGEFIVGYRNEYDELTYMPDVVGWDSAARGAKRFSLNGTYLAVRQIEQDLPAYEAWASQQRSSTAPAPFNATPAEKMMGRRKDGTSLLRPPRPPHAGTAADERAFLANADAFRYRVEDADGFLCPNGAHVRRVNPRDSLGVDVRSGVRSSKLHRLLRRGRPYLDESDPAYPHVGMLFIACNADLERQFEFIHKRWLRNTRFDGLAQEDDPLVGCPSTPRKFSIPGFPTGREISLANFTTTLGGGYFFLPSIPALKFIAQPQGVSTNERAGP